MVPIVDFFLELQIYWKQLSTSTTASAGFSAFSTRIHQSPEVPHPRLLGVLLSQALTTMASKIPWVFNSASGRCPGFPPIKISRPER